MISKKIAIFTAIHFVIACLFWFLALGASMGLGFKDNWEVWDYAYNALSIGGAVTLTFPLWLLSFIEFPGWMAYLFLPFQILVSFTQVKLFIYVRNALQIRNQKRQTMQNQAHLL